MTAASRDGSFEIKEMKSFLVLGLFFNSLEWGQHITTLVEMLPEPLASNIVLFLVAFPVFPARFR